MKDIEQQIERYLDGIMDEEEAILFLKEIEAFPEALQKLNAYREMNIVYNQNDWLLTDTEKLHPKVRMYEAFLKNKKGQHLANTIANAAQNYDIKQSHYRKQWITYASAIAAVLVLGFFTYIQFRTPDHQRLYASYKNWDTLPSLITRSENTNRGIVENLFKGKAYEAALQIIERHSLDVQLQFYKGAIALEMDKTASAIKIFEGIAQGDSLDAAKGYWYLALAYLKKEAVSDAKKALQMLLQHSNFQKQEAESLLDALE